MLNWVLAFHGVIGMKVILGFLCLGFVVSCQKELTKLRSKSDRSKNQSHALTEQIKSFTSEDFSSRQERLRVGVDLDPEFTQERIEVMIFTDLAQNPERGSRRNFRYFSFRHMSDFLAKQQNPEVMEKGLSKLLNSLSLRPFIVNPVAVDPEKTIFRIDLRDYGWSQKLWRVIVSRSPYAVKTDSRIEKAIQDFTGERKVHLRGDWFLRAGSQGFLYNTILNMPDDLKGLERALDINLKRNVRQGRALRLAFNNSRVAINNRILERHDQKFGYFWISWDFESVQGNRERNIFDFPFEKNLFSRSGHERAGGEIIFSLPNGLQAYMVIDDQDGRIDEVPVNVANEIRRPNKTVTNALSCMGCHNKGLNIGKDQLRARVEQFPGAYNRDVARAVLDLHAPEGESEAVYEADNAVFARALSELNLSPRDPEPILIGVEVFEDDITADRAAKELGITKDSLIRGLRFSDKLGRRLGGLIVNQTVDRDNFQDNFRNLVELFNLGEAINRNDADLLEKISNPKQGSR